LFKTDGPTIANPTSIATNSDLRAAAAAAYVWSLECVDKKEKNKPTESTIALCKLNDQKIKGTIENLLNSQTPYSVNTNIILEHQLTKFYRSILDTSSDDEVSGKVLHHVWMYLLIALKEYRAGMYDHA